MKNVHLFFDVYIEDAPLGKYLRGDRRRFDADHRIRNTHTNYRYQTKLNITRYTLHSYAQVDWTSATIRIYCENQDHVWIYDEIRALFPKAKIERRRSSSGDEFRSAIDELRLPENDWVFFSTNNDHPLLVDPIELEKVVESVDSLAARFTEEQRVAIPYSHFTEINNMDRPVSPLWGHYGGIFPKIVYENDLVRVLQLNKNCLDSILLLKFFHLKEIFEQNTNRGRIIRTEDTSRYLQPTRELFWACPKTELCRHYDGYTKFLDRVPPLFIPEGFFERNISVSIGKIRANARDVLVDPSAQNYSYQAIYDSADLRCNPDDLPYFWRDRISQVHCPDGYGIEEPSKSRYYEDLVNPWASNLKITNLLMSFWRLLKELLKFSKNIVWKF